MEFKSCKYVIEWGLINADGKSITQTTTCDFNTDTLVASNIVSVEKPSDEFDVIAKEYILVPDDSLYPTQYDHFKKEDGTIIVRGLEVSEISKDGAIEFLQAMNTYLEAHNKMIMIWNSIKSDFVEGVATMNYPFTQSFDEINVEGWVKNYETLFNKLIK